MKKIEKYTEVASIWEAYKSAIKSYILKKVKNEDSANDLSHEVLMKIYNSCCSGTEIKNIRSWMFQIAHNTVIDHWKAENRYVDELKDSMETEETNAYLEIETLIKPLLELLPEKYATPLLLSDIEGIKQTEVAQRINLSLTATKSRIQRARVLLKEKIIDCSQMETDSDGRPISIEIKSSCTPLQEAKKKNI
ncbi:sigma-70 family RNA polymerase sigma factor [Reichenbachiella ulvae]|uniref:Sigma-70 family RNA polymerase sigma factor n=1 Tax=Reichenbachiella ulvae TaxID=2980104 RepID=A0ABT3CNT6_9BACT|nr:sigma-70 family RNA polymerase sigma factor [Reichenbachiella ulvae]MCV9385406.1 sigma-70 family RNA polymerase sigma factor [Reichenbachiella ulvae]